MTKQKHAADVVGRTNAALYEAGKRYATRVCRLTAGGKTKCRLRDVTAECNSTAVQVAEAIKFADAVDLIAANCRGHARSLLLSDHPRLPAAAVMQISRTHAERQRFALDLARAGRDPLGKPPPGVEPPFDTLGYTEVLSRLARNAGLLNHVADGLLATPRRCWPDDDAVQDISRDAGLIRADCLRMSALMKKAGGRLDERREPPPWRARPAPRPFAPATAGPKAASVRGITAKHVRELPRVVSETPPTRVQADAVLEGIGRLRRSAERLVAVICARDHDLRTGPSVVPGTYVAFLHLQKAANRVRIGDLGTFDFPAGVYAYTGSAFSAGGVRGRTHRHLTRRSARPKWNIDYLKPLCTPVAVWWTSDREHVEFAWAALVAGLPGADFPAKKFGAADNKKAEAHLVRFDRMPSVAEFRRRAGEVMPGHAPIYEKTITDWAGRGWPE